MNSTDESEHTIDDLYQEYWSIHSAMMDQGHTPLEIAAILVAQSMSIYKTVLDSEDYDKMVDDISRLRYNVQELKLHEGSYH